MTSTIFFNDKDGNQVIRIYYIKSLGCEGTLIRIGSWHLRVIRLPECGEGVDDFPDVAAALHIWLEVSVGYHTPALKEFEDLPASTEDPKCCVLSVASGASGLNGRTRRVTKALPEHGQVPPSFGTPMQLISTKDLCN
jgi:hypothetical protein